MNRMTLAAAYAAVFTLTAGAAFADDAVVAKLQQPIAARTKFIAGGAMFVCEADTCVAAAPTSETFATNVCKTIAGKVGVVASFTGPSAMDSAHLGACNAVAVAKAAAGGTVLAKQ